MKVGRWCCDTAVCWWRRWRLMKDPAMRRLSRRIEARLKKMRKREKMKNMMASNNIWAFGYKLGLNLSKQENEGCVIHMVKKEREM
ncbi:hypothetical protein QVD17_27538 [Tagetes erecta]|uniref:Uncharacterized protein n=1 Tax=Tagetes erecta TaxID=13708 RepID=A0AAD8K995_TARER|nr:hypothetical protein QVD17_27538 [Tagetes erecta]